jgi:hypothetical protein
VFRLRRSGCCRAPLTRFQPVEVIAGEPGSGPRSHMSRRYRLGGSKARHRGGTDELGVRRVQVRGQADLDFRRDECVVSS